jgi:phosphatidylinositol alpha-1,6-mannosyltransferase
LKALARELGVHERVHILGPKDENELLSWYRRCDIFLLNSTNQGEHFEGFGLVLLEANACGKPVVGCLDCGAEDIITNGENGFLVPQNDHRKTADALSAILTDPDLARRMGEQAFGVARKLSWEQSARKMFEHYQHVLGRRKTNRK